MYCYEYSKKIFLQFDESSHYSLAGERSNAKFVSVIVIHLKKK